MRVIWISFVLIALTPFVFGQTVPAPFPPSPPLGGLVISSINPSMNQIDENGNLLVFDISYAYSGQPLPTIAPVRNPIPTTRITVVPSGSPPVSKSYPNTAFQVAGAGRWGTYAILTIYTVNQNRMTTTRTLIAINAGPAGAALPDKATDFVSAELPARATQIQVSASTDTSPDILYSVDGPSNPIVLLPMPMPMPTPMPTAAPISIRTARIYKYGANHTFSSTQVNLP